MSANQSQSASAQSTIDILEKEGKETYLFQK